MTNTHIMNYKIKKLSEIIIENKKSILKSNGNNDGIYPFFVSGFNTKKIDNYLIDGKSIFLPTGGNFFVHYFDGKSAYSTDTWSIMTTDYVDIRYLYHYLILNQDYISKKLFKGATIKHLQKNDFRELKIMIPSLSEQQRIVKILDEVFENIAKAKENAEKNLANSKELFESYLRTVFCDNTSWDRLALGDICDFFNGYAFKSSEAIKASNTQLIRMGNLYHNHLDLDRRAVYYPDSFIDIYKDYLLNEGDLIISLTGTTGKEDYGYVVNVPKATKRLLLNQRISKIVIIDKTRTDRGFLGYYLLSRSFLDKMYKTAHGTRQANLSTEKMKKINIRMPLLTEQRSIVAKLDALSAETKKLESIYKQKIADLDELKKSILQKAFAGEL